jgi:hypothetical protein
MVTPAQALSLSTRPRACWRTGEGDPLRWRVGELQGLFAVDAISEGGLRGAGPSKAWRANLR